MRDFFVGDADLSKAIASTVLAGYVCLEPRDSGETLMGVLGVSNVQRLFAMLEGKSSQTSLESLMAMKGYVCDRESV